MSVSDAPSQSVYDVCVAGNAKGASSSGELTKARAAARQSMAAAPQPRHDAVKQWWWGRVDAWSSSDEGLDSEEWFGWEWRGARSRHRAAVSRACSRRAARREGKARTSRTLLLAAAQCATWSGGERRSSSNEAHAAVQPRCSAGWAWKGEAPARGWGASSRVPVKGNCIETGQTVDSCRDHSGDLWSEGA